MVGPSPCITKIQSFRNRPSSPAPWSSSGRVGRRPPWAAPRAAPCPRGGPTSPRGLSSCFSGTWSGRRRPRSSARCRANCRPRVRTGGGKMEMCQVQQWRVEIVFDEGVLYITANYDVSAGMSTAIRLKISWFKVGLCISWQVNNARFVIGRTLKRADSWGHWEPRLTPSPAPSPP